MSSARTGDKINSVINESNPFICEILYALGPKTGSSRWVEVVSAHGPTHLSQQIGTRLQIINRTSSPSIEIPLILNSK